MKFQTYLVQIHTHTYTHTLDMYDVCNMTVIYCYPYHKSYPVLQIVGKYFAILKKNNYYVMRWDMSFVEKITDRSLYRYNHVFEMCVRCSQKKGASHVRPCRCLATRGRRGATFSRRPRPLPPPARLTRNTLGLATEPPSTAGRRPVGTEKACLFAVFGAYSSRTQWQPHPPVRALWPFLVQSNLQFCN